MKTRFFFLTAFLTFSFSSYAEEFTVDGIRYNGDETSMTATVTGTADDFDKANVVIPEVVNGYTVTCIGARAFSKKNITSFVMPNTITIIERNAFYHCSYLQTIKMSESVISIGEYAFNLCAVLQEIEFTNSLQSIGECAFVGCGFVSLNLPQSIKTIPVACFTGCNYLKEVNIPASVTKIGRMAFDNCENLTSVFIPKSVVEFEEEAANTITFGYCPNLKSIVVDEDNPVYDSRNNCNAIIRTTDNVLMLGCNTTTIPASVTSIHEMAFCGSGIQNITIPDNVENIGNNVFYECKKLISARLPANITTIPLGLFQKCDNLSEITIPSSVSTIEVVAFSNCTSLKNINIPNSVKVISERAFLKSGLDSIELPYSLTSIGRRAFDGCDNLRIATSKIIDPFEIDGVFNNEVTSILYVPKGTKNKYLSTSGWNMFKTILEEGESLEQPVTITADNLTMTYGDDVPALTYKSEGGELYGIPSLSTTATKTSPVGTYPITVTKGTVTNEQVTYVAGTLTISKAPLTVGVKNETITEGDAIPAFTLTYSGFRNSDTEATAFTTKPVAKTTATPSSAAGTYPITVSGGEAQNYALTFKQGTLTIEKKIVPVTITADNQNMTYGDNVPKLTYKSEGAELNGTPSLTTTATKTSPVGTYPITVTKGTVTNEQVTYVAGTLTITKAPLTVGVKNETITEGDAIPAFTLTYSGFRNSDTEATAFTTKPVAKTTATPSSAAGTYPITVSGGEAQNYALTYGQGTLTIEEKEVDGVSSIKADEQPNSATYNLAGQKVNTQYKGIVIRNGKKVMK